MAKRIKKTTTLTGAALARAMNLHPLAVEALRGAGMLGRCAVEVDGQTHYTTYALPLVALADDLASEVAAGRLDQEEAGRVFAALVPKVYDAWDVYLRSGRVVPVRFEKLTFRSIERAAAA